MQLNVFCCFVLFVNISRNSNSMLSQSYALTSQFLNISGLLTSVCLSISVYISHLAAC